MRKHAVAAFAILGLLAGPALAQATPPVFATVDADASGGVSFEEAQIAWPDLTQEVFTAADANADGQLDQTEFDAYVASLPAAQ